MNIFFAQDTNIDYFPQRVYARLDQVDIVDDDLTYFQLDCCDADWYDDVYRENLDLNKFLRRIPLYVIEVKVDINYPERIEHINNAQVIVENNNESPVGWVELTLTRNGKTFEVNVYQNIFSPPQVMNISEVKYVSPEDAQKLDKSFSLDDIEDASEDSIRDILTKIKKIEYSAVYDVGQGNCNGFCNEDGAVECYFDFGGGVLANLKTYPPQLKSYCLKDDTVIILSHWDWDHWSSASRDTRALSKTWIVPRQRLGAIHRAYAQDIHAKGKLMVWPSNLPKINAGQIKVIKCIGKGRNHSGLAVVLSENMDGSGKKMLFTGDARYNVIPNSLGSDYINIVVPHHGGDVKNKKTPCYSHSSVCRLAYSYGKNNTFGHPNINTRNNHYASNWGDTVINRQTKNCKSAHNIFTNIETVKNNITRPSHIMLRWDASQQKTDPPCKVNNAKCNGNCDLKLKQE